MNLEKRWIELWDKLPIKGGISGKLYFAKMQKHYEEEGRFYHNFGHIEDCLKEFDRSKHISKNCSILEFAIWHHDILYNTKSKENEKKSAKIAYENSLILGLSEDFAKKAKKLILATDHLHKIPKTIDEKLIVDIDLSKLGKEEKEFDSYEKKLRQEYIWVPEELFKKGRAKIIGQFLERETIFFTGFFIEKYEEKARNNLKRSLEKLTG